MKMTSLPKYDKWQENVIKFNSGGEKDCFSSTIFNKKTIDGDVTRLNSRYGLYKAYQGINLDGYSQDTNTVESYSALFRAFLAYNVFESYRNVIM